MQFWAGTYNFVIINIKFSLILVHSYNHKKLATNFIAAGQLTKASFKHFHKMHNIIKNKYNNVCNNTRQQQINQEFIM